MQFVIIYLGNLNIELVDLKRKIIEFCNKYRKYNIYHAVSFGFDYIAIDCYKNFLDGSYKIRISTSDLPEETIIFFKEQFVKFLNKKILIKW